MVQIGLLAQQLIFWPECFAAGRKLTWPEASAATKPQPKAPRLFLETRPADVSPPARFQASATQGEASAEMQAKPGAR